MSSQRGELNFPHVICWDLDETLGQFDRIFYESVGDTISRRLARERDFGIRYGIKDLLQDLSGQGFRHTVTTAASEAYAVEALKRSGLSRFFDSIWSVDILYSRNQTDGRKRYGGVEEGAFFDDVDRQVYPHNMIVVGDSDNDQPGDLENLVFIHDQLGFRHDAVVLAEILSCLLEAGKGSFKTGFDNIFNQGNLMSIPGPLTQKQPINQVRRYILDNGISFHLQYGNSLYAKKDFGTTFPRIFDIEAEAYSRKLVKITQLVQFWFVLVHGISRHHPV